MLNNVDMFDTVNESNNQKDFLLNSAITSTTKQQSMILDTPHYEPPAADSGANLHLISDSELDLCQQEFTTKLNTPIPIQLADGQPSNLRAVARTHMHDLPGETYIVEGGLMQTLISIGQLDANGCKAVFEKGKLTVTRNGATLATGEYKGHNGMYIMTTLTRKPFGVTNWLGLNYSSSPIEDEIQSNRAFFFYVENRSLHDQIRYWVEAFGYPSMDELTDAVKNGRVAGWPSHLTPDVIRRNWPQTDEYVQGHLQKHAVPKKGHVIFKLKTKEGKPVDVTLYHVTPDSRRRKYKVGHIQADSHGPNGTPARGGETSYMLFVIPWTPTATGLRYYRR